MQTTMTKKTPMTKNPPATTNRIDNKIVRVIVTPSPTSRYKTKASNIGRRKGGCKVTRRTKGQNTINSNSLSNILVPPPTLYRTSQLCDQQFFTIPTPKTSSNNRATGGPTNSDQHL